MKILMVGHSVIHPRQNMLGLEMANDDVQICMVSPKQWGVDIAPDYVMGLDILPYDSHLVGFNGFFLKHLEVIVHEFKPDIIFAMQEPYTCLAWQCRCLAKENNAKLVVFTWENIESLRMPGIHNEIEKQILLEADLVVCGNNDAVKRVHSIVPTAKTTVIPQTGVNTEHFKPLLEIPKLYDISSFGRFVEEKMGMWNRLLQMRSDLKSLTVGGKGNISIQSGTVIGWQNFSHLPVCYNSVKVFLALPYNHDGYNEQFNYTIAEALSCGIPVIASENGSIPEIYKDAPNLYFVEEGSTGLGAAIYNIDRILTDSKEPRDELSRKGREWVKSSLSLQAIANRYVTAFGEVMNG